MGRRQTSKQAPPSRDAATLVLPPSLYLGPCSAASSPPFLTRNSITHVLSIGANPLASRKVDGVTYHRLALRDSDSSSISGVVDAACEIIDAAIAAPSESGGSESEGTGMGKILVHCAAGISRSPAVVAAYLMKRKGMTLRAALGQIVRARPCVSPNAGFMRQLREMEREVYGRGGGGSLEDVVGELPRREKDRLALFEREQPEAEPKLQGRRLRSRLVAHPGPSRRASLVRRQGIEVEAFEALRAGS